MADERIDSIRLTDKKGILGPVDDVYELDFNRESVVFAENRGFKPGEIGDFPVTKIADLFYYSFRMHHRRIAREKIDKLREAWGGIPESVLKRLAELYNQAMTSNNIQSDEDAEKNEAVAVEL